MTPTVGTAGVVGAGTGAAAGGTVAGAPARVATAELVRQLVRELRGAMLAGETSPATTARLQDEAAALHAAAGRARATIEQHFSLEATLAQLAGIYARFGVEPRVPG